MNSPTSTSTFKPNLRFERGLDSYRFSERKLSETPNLWSFPLLEARKRSRGVLEPVLARMQDDPRFKEQELRVAQGKVKSYVDSWFTQTTTGQVPSPYGLHVDGSKKSPQGWDLDNLGSNDEAWMFLMVLSGQNGSSNPLFVTDTFSVLREELDPKAPFVTLHRTAFPQVLDGRLKSTSLPSGVLAVYNGNTVHTAMPTRVQRGKYLPRVLVRVSFLPHHYPYAQIQRRPNEVPLFEPRC